MDGTKLDTFGIVVVAFLVTDKANHIRFFEETFFVANVSPEVVFGMLFFSLSGVDVDFLDLKLQWRTYTTEKALPTTRRIELVGKKEFAIAALDPESEIFIVYVMSLSSDVLPSFFLFELDIYPFRRPQVSDLIAEEASTKVFAGYLDFVNVFSLDLASKLLKYIGINNHAMKLVDGQQPYYEPIYSLGLVELKTLKAYIKMNLANRFIKPSKFPANAPMLFDQKSDSFLQL